MLNFNNGVINESLGVLERRYSNYNFYFTKTSRGVKEVKKIYVYDECDNGHFNIILTLDKPWFGKMSKVILGEQIEYRDRMKFDNKLFCISDGKPTNVCLYIPNRLIKAYKDRTRVINDYYRTLDIYKFQHPQLENVEIEINGEINQEIYDRVQKATLRGKSSFVKIG